MTTGTLLIRADASPAIGTGHVMRCLALAQAWQDAGGTAVFAMAESTPAICSRIQAEHCDVFSTESAPGAEHDLTQTIALLQKHKCEWIAVDGYQFGAEYQLGLKAAGFNVLFLDDYGHSQHYSADLVLNQNISATPALYANREQETRLILGPRYALLRREFNIWNDWQRLISPVGHRVLITMGGNDEGNVTATAIEALRLAEVPDLSATVVVGGSNPHCGKLPDIVARSQVEIELLKDVSNIGELMATADVAISAAGTTCWELCMLGLPALLIDVADNQTALAKELHKRGCAIHIGNVAVKPETIAERIKALAQDQSQRQSLSNASRKLVDGRGATRVVSLLRGRPTMRLRPSRSEDRRLLWEWANDPQVRAASFSSSPIPWETHLSWFAAKLMESQSPSAKCRMFVAEDEAGVPMGQIRFERRTDERWDVGISLSHEFRGRGLASELIESGIRELIKQNGECSIHAFVRPENRASLKSFERAKFETVGIEHVRGQMAVHLLRP